MSEEFVTRGTPVMPETGQNAVFDTRISALEREMRDMSVDISNLSGQFERSINASITTFGRQMDALSAKVDERSKVPWPALGVMLSFITVIGGLVWYPVNDKQAKLESSISHLSETSVTKADLDYRLAISGSRRDDFQRLSEARDKELDSKLEQIRERVVPRGEHEEKWRSADQRFTDAQRQIEDIKRAFGDTFSLRDALQQMQKRIDYLETQSKNPTNPAR